VPNEAQIRHGNAAAQRGGVFHIQFCKLLFHQTLAESSLAVVPVRNHNYVANLMLPPPIPRRNLPQLSVSRVLPNQSGLQREAVALPFPPRFRDDPLEPGYQAAHARYTEIRDYLANKAYASGQGTEVVTVRASMTTQAPGRKTPLTVGVSSNKPLSLLTSIPLTITERLRNCRPCPSPHWRP
jgi:hypothetical protein